MSIDREALKELNRMLLDRELTRLDYILEAVKLGVPASTAAAMAQIAANAHALTDQRRTVTQS